MTYISSWIVKIYHLGRDTYCRCIIRNILINNSSCAYCDVSTNCYIINNTCHRTDECTISNDGSVFFIGSDIDELIYCHIIANNSIRVNY